MVDEFIGVQIDDLLGLLWLQLTTIDELEDEDDDDDDFSLCYCAGCCCGMMIWKDWFACWGWPAFGKYGPTIAGWGNTGHMMGNPGPWLTVGGNG